MYRKKLSAWTCVMCRYAALIHQAALTLTMHFIAFHCPMEILRYRREESFIHNYEFFLVGMGLLQDGCEDCESLLSALSMVMWLTGGRAHCRCQSLYSARNSYRPGGCSSQHDCVPRWSGKFGRAWWDYELFLRGGEHFIDVTMLLFLQRIDMVPGLLSSNLCSLMSNVDR